MRRWRLTSLLIPLIAVLALAACLLGAASRANADDRARSNAASTRPVSSPVAAPEVSANEQPSGIASSGWAALPASDEGVLPEQVTATKPTPQEADLTTLPVGGGLPVLVGIAVSVLELHGFDDVKGEYEATTDLRLRWSDPRLRFQSRGVTAQYDEYRGKEAEDHLAKLWTPNVEVSNRLETHGYVGRRLRIFSDGQVETIVRSTGRYKADVDVRNFPFDVQALAQRLIVRDQTTDQVMLHFDKDDQVFSRAVGGVQLESWGIGDVELDSDLVDGWNGDRYARVTASLMITRSASSGLTTIFIPLLASLLIPLLTLWMNRPTVEGFEVPAFELANMGIGGLFSVIALSLAVTSSYTSLAGSDNTVTRLFALNYATLGISLAIVVLLYRGNLVLRLFGPYVHEQVFRFLLWAVPVLTLGTSLAFVLVAAC